MSVWRHSIERDAKQIEFHYDLSDDFYALVAGPAPCLFLRVFPHART